MAKAGVPDAVGYQPKWQMALAMVRRAQANGFRGVVLADSLFGTVTEFREQLAPGRPDVLRRHRLDAQGDRRGRRPRPGPDRTRPRPAADAAAKVRAGATSPSVKEWALDHAAGLPPGDLAGGVEGEDDGPVRRLAGPAGPQAVGREGAAGAVLAAGRVAGGRRTTRRSTSSATCRRRRV